ncbi:hypothetical protein ACH4L7_35330 [Streptomyces anulatus]
MSLNLDTLPFALDAEGPDGRWTHADGVLSGRAGPGQDLFVSPSGDSKERAAARAGFLVQSPTGEGCGAVFDRTAFLVGGVEDLRDGR